jgi:hypothetical protein
MQARHIASLEESISGRVVGAPLRMKLNAAMPKRRKSIICCGRITEKQNSAKELVERNHQRFRNGKGMNCR